MALRVGRHRHGSDALRQKPDYTNEQETNGTDHANAGRRGVLPGGRLDDSETSRDLRFGS